MNGVPDVSVIIAAYNAGGLVTRCVESVERQTLGTDALECVVVDDGSTDGTGEELDGLAATRPWLRVIHQDNSGGPAGPRNTGLDVARGRYVFFLDADDWLGEQALERMLAMATEHGSDIVLGRMVGSGGRTVPRTMFVRNQTDAPLFASRVYWALNPLKLFRRDFLEQLGLRFRTDLPVGQDQPFVATAYLRARRISVVADYDCYYADLRSDGQNNTRRPGGARRRLPFLRAMFELIPSEVPEGPDRDLLLRRHFQSEQREFLEHLGLEPDPRVRQEAFAVFRGFVRRWCGQGVLDGLPAGDRLRLELIRRGRMDEAIRAMRFHLDREPWTVHCEKGRAYADYPYFRDPELGIPDSFFDVTDELVLGHYVTEVRWSGARLRLAGAVRPDRYAMSPRARAWVLVRERDGDGEYRVPFEPGAAGDRLNPEWDERQRSEAAGFATAVAPLDAVLRGGLGVGVWDLYLEVEDEGVLWRTRMGARRAPGIETRRTRRTLMRFGGRDARVRTVEYYFTGGGGGLSLKVRRTPLRPRVLFTHLARPGSLRSGAHLVLVPPPLGALQRRLHRS
ncbi:glycosyltransferase family 2 protein [Nocardiopsis sp. FIRDI 009]|uniref:glycosyltransferase family 2 protein n=1 Tax=Nocardiopsis sp. FIRDI 009 TaxID=714197 RepID=UPI000E256E1D|nr:glycosyltransferase family 2 protein [Nocardiopsis sp. FIRDI 009]